MKKWSSIKKEMGAAPWEYGDLVQLRNREPKGLWMLLGHIVLRHDDTVGDALAAVCIVPPSDAWDEGTVSRIWINQCEVIA